LFEYAFEGYSLVSVISNSSDLISPVRLRNGKWMYMFTMPSPSGSMSRVLETMNQLSTSEKVATADQLILSADEVSIQ